MTPDIPFYNKRIAHPQSRYTDVIHTIDDEHTKKLLLAEINQLVNYDFLTGLFNRRKFLNELDVMLSNNKEITLLLLQIDRFEFLNEAYGFSVGDEIIKEAAIRIQHCMPPESLLAKLDGNEFGIQVTKQKHIKQVEELADHILKQFDEPFTIQNGSRLNISVSIGINCCVVSKCTDVDTVLNQAFLALKFARNNGNGQAFYYNSFLDRINRKATRLKVDIQFGLLNDQFSLCYQPQQNLQDNSVDGVEALLRWNHPTYGTVSPAEFIPIAEKTKQIIPIGEWVIGEGVKQAKKMLIRGISFGRMALNVSPVQFFAPDFVEKVEAIITREHLDPKYIELEITESVIFNLDKSLEIINKLKRIGLNVSLDDFGTGFSSLNVLNKLPLDGLKIDRSFISQLLHDEKTKILTQYIIQMANVLNIEVIAEGIEELPQLEYLKSHQCSRGQGFLFSKPLTSDLLENYLIKNNRYSL